MLTVNFIYFIFNLKLDLAEIDRQIRELKELKYRIHSAKKDKNSSNSTNVPFYNYSLIQICPITSLVFNKKRELISGSYDKTIRILDLEKGQCIRTLTGHTHYIWSLTLIEETTLVSASSDATI
jgi:WD40 repeat protein